MQFQYKEANSSQLDIKCNWSQIRKPVISQNTFTKTSYQIESFYKIATPIFDKIKDNTKSLAQSLKNIG